MSDKDVLWKVYTSAGLFKRAWRDVATLPSYSWSINAGPASMQVTLPREWGSVGEPGETGSVEDIRLGNRVEVYVHDRETPPEGLLVYNGRIEDYVSSDPPGQGLKMTLMTRNTLFSDNAFEDEVELANYDPSAMMQYLVETWLPACTWAASNVSVGSTFTQAFERQSVGSAAETIRRLGGGRWFYRLNPDDSLTFAEWRYDTATHELNGNHFAAVKYHRSMVGLLNMVRLYGKQRYDAEGNLIDRVYAEVSNSNYSTSDPRIGRFEYARVNDYAAARRIAAALLEESAKETIETEIEIPDNTVDGVRGYDIESLRPGQTLALLNPAHIYRTAEYDNDDYYDNDSYYDAPYAGLVQLPLVIANVDYRFLSAVVKLTNRPVGVTEALVNVDDRILMQAST